MAGHGSCVHPLMLPQSEPLEVGSWSQKPTGFGTYCWWKKSRTTWDVNSGISYLSTGAGFLPSTVSPDCLKPEAENMTLSHAKRCRFYMQRFWTSNSTGDTKTQKNKGDSPLKAATWKWKNKPSVNIISVCINNKDIDHFHCQLNLLSFVS